MTTYRDPFPILYVADVERSLGFYRNLLGFTVGYEWREGDVLGFVALALDDGRSVGLARRTPDAGERFELCLLVDDADAACEELRAKGVSIRTEPQDQPWGERMFYADDPDGNAIHVRAPI
jgi:catechol 2,3-dioxygenase-like lactoylglutathione lyase family enzyme